jgi:tetratricopeptide (TPR) repeat protein
VRQQIRDVPRPANFEAFRQLSDAYGAWSKGLNELALASLESALTLDPDLEEAASVAVAVARTARDINTAQVRFRQWIEMAQRKNHPLVAGERLMMLGHWLFTHGEWEKARKVYQEAGSIYRREDHEHGKIQAQNNLANIDLQQGKIQAAIQTYRRSLRSLEDLPDDTERDEAVALFNLALAHKNLGQTDESMRAVEQAIGLAQSLKDTHLQAKCLMQRGVLYDDGGEWGRASGDYAQALRLFDILSDEKNMAMVKNHQALIFKQQGAYDRAEALLLQALQTFDDEPDIHERAIICFNLAELYYSMQLYEQAWEYAEQAQTVFTQLRSGWLTLAKELIEMLNSIPDSSETNTFTPPASPQ